MHIHIYVCKLLFTYVLGILEDISQSKAESIDVENEDSTTSKIDNESVAILPSQSNSAIDQDCWDKKREDLISFMNSSCPFSSIPFSSAGTYINIYMIYVYVFMCIYSYKYI
jgi:hypothetical protein